jgi:cytochrome c oxidase subunit 3
MSAHPTIRSNGEDAAAARSNMLLGVKLGILSEAMLFAALFAAYFVIRSESAGWPPNGQVRPELILPGINTVLLLSSSATMQMAVRAIARGELAGMRFRLRLTLLLGGIFIVIQGYEFATNGFGLDAGTFGSTFYILTGFHGVHVLAGLGLMAIIATRARHGLISAEHATVVEATTYYWHFVVAAGLFLFATLYVL